ncbi:hypothetical protein Nans01_12150 [Nocardiopsis ansamitocini]|uniref:Uncharacterized protein n=1 Tax=Nocardiopsis ansamitocini TaxID=1670832 RepID=A0A9W6UHQ3_9ACTN|nr:hypothetical protein Nans01_12150 [Nocardiopsis ansamitocini]
MLAPNSVSPPPPNAVAVAILRARAARSTMPFASCVELPGARVKAYPHHVIQTVRLCREGARHDEPRVNCASEVVEPEARVKVE